METTLMPYQQRAIDQGLQWVAGESHHNLVDDECCPDFSCCEPRLFERCPAKRMSEYNRWARGYGFAEIESRLSPEFMQTQADEAPRLDLGANV